MALLINVAGILIMLVGLVWVGTQVNVHRIKPMSAAAWVWRAGTLLIAIGLLLGLTDPVVVQVSRLIGAMLISASIIVIGHEWSQAGEVRETGYHFQPTRVMLGLFMACLMAALLVMLGVGIRAGWAGWASLALFALMIIFWWQVAISPERAEVGFEVWRSLSLQMSFAGVLLLVIGMFART
jgi:hypothetical protein